MTIQEKISKAIILQERTRIAETKIDQFRKEMFEELNSKFPLIIQKEERRNQEWKSDEFENEIQILLRSMLTRNEIVKVKTEDDYQFNLTIKHGLKYPRSHSCHDILPARWDDYDKNRGFQKDGLYVDGREKFDFNSLKGHKWIDSAKLEKFLYFLKEIVGLWKYYKLMDKDLERLEKKELKSLDTDLSDYANLETFEAYIKAIPKIEILYAQYAKRLKSFMERQLKLLNEIQDFNKPFKILIKLKESPTE